MERLTEEDIKLRFITPAIVEKAGWSREQLSMEAFIPGPVNVPGTTTRRGHSGKADYLLRRSHSGQYLAIVEAKDSSHAPGAGLQQAITYARKLDVPFAYSSNGHAFVEHDFLTHREREFPMDRFPTEAELWRRYCEARDITPENEAIIAQPYHYDPFTKKEPRYYQRIAIDRVVEAISKGEHRLLLVMATGTGKTFTAFQIIWRLLEAGKVKRVLYLADRNYLIDQTVSGDFNPLKNRMTKVRNRHLDSSYEVYFSLYHQMSGEAGAEPFRQFTPDFFDLVVVDECHRGSASQDSQWRAVLDYYSSAIHLGLTATPKETKEVSSTTYFGDPVYTYSLREGIADGFLAPYKVLRPTLNVDAEGWRPEEGKQDVDGKLVEDREYNVSDFDRNLIIDERTQMVAKYITSWLRKYGRDSKTIVFCVDIEHAERMRQALVNENSDEMKRDHRYVMRITGDDEAGKNQLENFTDVNEAYPTLVTTSQLLTTGVDIPTLKLIVVEKNISSMIEFKQIIGRGTRLAPKHGKEYFTILDFRGSTRLFADPDFDGDPVVVIDLPDPGDGSGDPDWPDDDLSSLEDNTQDRGEEPETKLDLIADLDSRDPRKKVRVDGVDVKLLSEREQFINPVTGQLVTGSIIAYWRQIVLDRYGSFSEFLQAWKQNERKGELIRELCEQQGVFLEKLREEAGESVSQMDDFDLIVHVAFDRPPLTRQERANKVKKRGYLHKYSAECQAVLDRLLDKYAELGVTPIEDIAILYNAPFKEMGSPSTIVEFFGQKADYCDAVRDLIDSIYSV